MKKTTSQEEHQSENRNPHMDYYGYDDHSSASGEETDHLN